MDAIRQYLGALVDLVRREPIRTFAVIRSIIVLIVAFWPGVLTPDQTIAILGLATAWLGIDEVIRQQTTPTSAPKLEEGTPVQNPAVTVDTPPPDLVVARADQVIASPPARRLVS